MTKFRVVTDFVIDTDAPVQDDWISTLTYLTPDEIHTQIREWLVDFYAAQTINIAVEEQT